MNLSEEWALYAKLKLLDPKASIFEGITTFEERKQSARAIIRKIGPQVIYAVVKGKPVTLGEQFIKVYGGEA